MSPVYFNPNWDPEYYYSLLKPLLLVYEQILIWNVKDTDIERYCGDVGGFISFLDDTFRNDQPPALVPVGRETWFDSTSRAKEYSQVAKNTSASFVEDVKKYSDAYVTSNGNGIVPVSDRGPATQALLSAWNSDPDWLRTRAKLVDGAFSGTFRQIIDELGQAHRYEPAQAIINAFFQDLRAMKYVGCQAPIVKFALLHGYEATDWGRENRTTQSAPLVHQRPWVPLFGDDISPDELRELVSNLHNSKNLSWNEVLQFRRSANFKRLRRYLLRVSPDTRSDLGLSITQLALRDAKGVAHRVDTASSTIVSVATGIAAGAVTANPFFGFVIGSGLLAADSVKDVVKNGLELFGVKARVNSVVSKLIVHGDQRIFLDTPYLRSGTAASGATKKD